MRALPRAPPLAPLALLTLLVAACRAGECDDALEKFEAMRAEDELSDVDLAIARLKLVPFYLRKCKRASRWSAVMRGLEDEARRRLPEGGR
tara:strand:- start:1896 stop:2168 length:273 start_codon:yes stop_codon:yes gene_type:complete